ncbi:hypothetical protein PUR_23010 [Paenibacillus sp. URB8-2]|nr:hypothetical protein PUR_23010 [Paenibacillus sp. URB8-2]
MRTLTTGKELYSEEQDHDPRGVMLSGLFDFWSQSYCLTTVGGAPLEVLKTYIENQGKEAETR